MTSWHLGSFAPRYYESPLILSTIKKLNHLTRDGLQLLDLAMFTENEIQSPKQSLYTHPTFLDFVTRFHEYFSTVEMDMA